MDVDASFISVGIAGAAYRYLAESNQVQSAENAAAALEALSGIPIPEAIGYFEHLTRGNGISTIRAAAEVKRHGRQGQII